MDKGTETLDLIGIERLGVVVFWGLCSPTRIILEHPDGCLGEIDLEVLKMASGKIRKGRKDADVRRFLWDNTVINREASNALR